MRESGLEFVDMIIKDLALNCIAGLAIALAREKYDNKLDEKKLRVSLCKYIEQHKKYNEVCSLQEEIDFHGFVEYIENKLCTIACSQVFSADRKERGNARIQIINAAYSYCNAQTEQSKKRVAKCIEDCFDIIKGFFQADFSPKDYLLAYSIVDAVSNEIHYAEESTTNEIKKSHNEIISKIEAQGALVSYDKAIDLADTGNYDEIGGSIKKLFDCISTGHPLYPYYGFDFINGKLLSKPLIPESKQKFPPRYKLTGSVRIGDHYFNNANDDPLQYSFRHQLPITIEVSDAVKYLGEVLDPRQDEVKCLVGNTVTAHPPEFPPAQPCSIKVGEKTYFDYILLRTQCIEDDGTCVIGNKEQSSCFYFEIRFNPKKAPTMDLKIHLNNVNNRDLLKYVQFMDALSKEKELHVYLLEKGVDFFSGKNNGPDYKSGFKSIDEEIDFLERVCVIEDYFKTSLDLTGAISDEEYNAVIRISKLIMNEELSSIWSEATFTGILDQRFRTELLSMDEYWPMFSYVGTCLVDLFGAHLEYKQMCTYKNAYVVDYEKVKQKAALLSDGDHITITFRPRTDNTMIETLKIPEEFSSVS